MNRKYLRFPRRLHLAGLKLTVLALLGFQLGSAAVTIVEDGTSTAPIVVFADAPQPTLQAADELADYIEKISGARPEIIVGEPEVLPQSAIWVGYQPVMQELFPDTDFEFEHPEEIQIVATDKHLALTGRDRWNPGQTEIKIVNGRYSRHVQLEYGTVNAIYTFLQDSLGVRWLWPGETDLIEQRTITLEPFEYRYHPQIRMRHGAIWRLSPYRVGGRLGSEGGDWARFQRLQLDSLVAPIGGHAFGDWWERFHETQPELFALQPDGSRSGYPRPRYAKVCESSPAVWEQWLKDVEAILEENPNETVFSCAANDSWASGHCICEGCRAWDNTDAEMGTFRWAGLVQDYYFLADRQVTFANTLGRLLKEKYPDKDYFVSMLSYGLSRPPPVAAVPDDNVLVASVTGFLLQHHAPIYETHKRYYEEWSEVTPRLLWRPNIGSPAHWKVGGPGDTTRTAETLRSVAEQGCVGLYFDTLWMYWSTQGPTYYLIAQMAWDPFVDTDALMADYFERTFGPAVGTMAEYWSNLETIRSEIVYDKEDWAAAFNPDALAQGYALLDTAAAEAATDQRDDYSQRVSFFRAGWDYLKLLTENIQLIARLKETKGEDRAAYAKAKENWQAIQTIAETYPLALSYYEVTGSNPGRLKFAHPDYYED